ncbi:MAG TPA: plastocyanin/azurin family copper-binding protein [Longimicrobiales bacterium]|nr:plastocyanin/azurin family copper-binding protein [Longimicrobiales bacterium]
MKSLLLAAAIAAGALVSCFSERAGPTALGPLADCSLPLDSTTIGRVGVVVIRDFAFHPRELRVPAGTRVTWINCETEANQRMAHTSTADAGAWGSPLLEFGRTYSAVFNTPGTYSYHCEPHPSMTASVIVE